MLSASLLSSSSSDPSSSMLIRSAASKLPKRVSALLGSGQPRIFAACDSRGFNVLAAPRHQPEESWFYKPYQLHRSQSISFGRPVLKDEEVPVRSPLSQVPMASTDSTAQTADTPEKPLKRGAIAIAVKTKIPQSPTKVNLVAKLVRGMRVGDALVQMEVLLKRAAGYVRSVLLSARANAVHNHGFDQDKLIVEEAFVGKGEYLKRIWPHGRGRSGIRTRKKCRLTIKVREMTATEERKLARLQRRVSLGKVVARAKLLPHKIIDARWSTPRITRERGGPWTVIKPKMMDDDGSEARKWDYR